MLYVQGCEGADRECPPWNGKTRHWEPGRWRGKFPRRRQEALWSLAAAVKEKRGSVVVCFWGLKTVLREKENKKQAPGAEGLVKAGACSFQTYSDLQNFRSGNLCAQGGNQN